MLSPSIRTWERVGLGALVLALIVGFAIYPSFPTYDSVYSLVWGHEIAHLQAPSFDAFRAPTEHPLGIFVAALLTPLGDGAGRALEFLMMASYLVLIAGAYRLARQAFTPLVGLASALILLSRFDFASLAVRGYIDIPYAAALVWAASLEYARPRRGGLVFLLLGLAGLMRPEAWAIAAAYWLWMAIGWRWTGARPDRSSILRWLGYAVAAPVVWLGFDLLVTGDPLFSFHATSETVGELGRSKPVAELPRATWIFLRELVKLPVIVAGVGGLLLAVWFVPRRALMPLLLLVTGLASFYAVGLAGLAVIDRYIVVAAVALCIFAGFAVGGFTVLRRGSPLQVAWAGAAALVAIVVVTFTLHNTLRLQSFRGELAYRTDAHDSLVADLHSPAVSRLRAAGCGPISTPTHKTVPDVRLILNLGDEAVIARNDPEYRSRIGEGLAIYVQGRRAMDLQGFDANTSALTEVPPPGWRRVASSKYFTVFARCTHN